MMWIVPFSFKTCDVCNGAMSLGRGGKRFCSKKCRQAFWTYTRIKERRLDRSRIQWAKLWVNYQAKLAAQQDAIVDGSL